MIPAQTLKEKLTPFLKTREADKVGIIFSQTSLQVSRFANSQIHQHMNDEHQLIYFRVLIDGRIGLASTNSLEEHNLKEAFKKALHIAGLRLDTPEKKDIPDFREIKGLKDYSLEKPVPVSAQTRAKILQNIFRPADSLKIKFSGNFYNGAGQLAVISPEGRMNYQTHYLAGIKLIAAQDNSSGYAGEVKTALEKLHPQAVADKAIEKCLLGLKKISLKPARYDVILEPAAVAEIILWLNYIGFGAKSVLEETSFLHNKTGKAITGRKVNIYDDGNDKNTFILPFDFEGRSRKKVYLIKNGTAGEPLCDSYYARLLKIKPNGHSNFPDEIDGPTGYNLVMQGGSLRQEEIIHSAKKAILISRFHYLNGFLDPKRALMTGMTKDGTFLVEEGRIKCAVKDIRFTESILEAFSRIKHISKERALIADHLEALGSICAPGLYIQDFQFTS